MIPFFHHRLVEESHTEIGSYKCGLVRAIPNNVELTKERLGGGQRKALCLVLENGEPGYMTSIQVSFSLLLVAFKEVL